MRRRLELVVADDRHAPRLLGEARAAGGQVHHVADVYLARVPGPYHDRRRRRTREEDLGDVAHARRARRRHGDVENREPRPGRGKRARQHPPRRVGRRDGIVSRGGEHASERHHGLFRSANGGDVRHAAEGRRRSRGRGHHHRRGVDDGKRHLGFGDAGEVRRADGNPARRERRRRALHRVRPDGRRGYRRDGAESTARR
mmetsp:Transcript_12317/g.51548  ORF Transcript_12317/g.51548 Transcript_12317/m.51548 type:complete len:200 (-) Transcript_12317:1866-2465(-)